MTAMTTISSIKVMPNRARPRRLMGNTPVGRHFRLKSEDLNDTRILLHLSTRLRLRQTGGIASLPLGIRSSARLYRLQRIP